MLNALCIKIASRCSLIACRNYLEARCVFTLVFTIPSPLSRKPPKGPNIALRAWMMAPRGLRKAWRGQNRIVKYDIEFTSHDDHFIMFFYAMLKLSWGYVGAILGVRVGAESIAIYEVKRTSPQHHSLGPSSAILWPSWDHLHLSYLSLMPKSAPTAKNIDFPEMFYWFWSLNVSLSNTTSMWAVPVGEYLGRVFSFLWMNMIDLNFVGIPKVLKNTMQNRSLRFKRCQSYRKIQCIMHFAPRWLQDALLWHVGVILRRSD